MKPLPCILRLPLLLLPFAARAADSPASAAPAAELGAIHQRVSEVTDDRVAGEGSGSCHVQLRLFGPGAEKIIGLRLATLAVTDDANDVLEPNPSDPEFHLVGRQGDPRIAYLSFTSPSRAAHAVALRGQLELYAPALDPDATADLRPPALTFGRPLASPALQKAGVQITLLSRTTDAAAIAPGDLAPDDRIFRFDLRQLAPTDVAVRIHDPDARVLDVDFVNGKGAALSRGWSSQEQRGWRLLLLHLPVQLTDDVHFVCRLRTERAIVPLPFAFHDVSLP